MKLIGEAELVEQFEGAAPDDERFRFVAGGGGFVDDAQREAVVGESGGGRQADGAGADDEDVELESGMRTSFFEGGPRFWGGKYGSILRSLKMTKPPGGVSSRIGGEGTGRWKHSRWNNSQWNSSCKIRIGWNRRWR